MGFVGSTVRIVCTRIVPVLVLLVAIFIGWLAQKPQPLGTLFAIIFPVMVGKLPPPIFGHGHMTGSTPPVPDDFLPVARPPHETFLTLPSGQAMPQAGLGMCCRYSAYDNVLVRRTVAWYLLLGGRLIDGAHMYLNHRAIGLGLQDAMARGVPREEIFMTTKVFAYTYGYEETLKIVPTFLEELQLDYIDLVLMHFPSHFPYIMSNSCTKRHISNAECRAETWKALSELQQKGMVKNIGVSNFATHHLQELQALPGNVAPIAVNQIQYNPWAPDFQVETFDYCQQHNISVTAYQSLGGTLQHAQAHTVEVLTTLSKKYEKSVSQLLLRWAIQTNAAVIPGTGNPKHMKENLGIYEFALSAEDYQAITDLRDDEDAKAFFYMAPPKD